MFMLKIENFFNKMMAPGAAPAQLEDDYMMLIHFATVLAIISVLIDGISTIYYCVIYIIFCLLAVFSRNNVLYYYAGFLISYILIAIQ